MFEGVDEVIGLISISLEDDGEGTHSSGVSSCGIAASTTSSSTASSWISSSSSSSWGSSRVTSEWGPGSSGDRSPLPGVGDVDGAWALGLRIGHFGSVGGLSALQFCWDIGVSDKESGDGGFFSVWR